VFFITGRTEVQRDATASNLKSAGYTAPTDAAHLYLKQPTPSSLSALCGGSDMHDHRVQVEHLGAHRIDEVPDRGRRRVQFSDLKGAHAGYEVKIPNPMYYLP
jgi:hypothetical protein